MIKTAGIDDQQIDPVARMECSEILEKIRQESPEFWPYGLHIDGHDSLYMIREASTRQAVGFCGWQVRHEFSEDGRKAASDAAAYYRWLAQPARVRHRKVGYYSIGILPEYRQNGLAKEALATMLAEKAASVDEVKAFIVEGNKPSMALAESLAIPVRHTSP